MPEQWLLTYLGPQDAYDDSVTQRRFPVGRAYAVPADVKDRLTEHTFRAVYHDTWNAEPLAAGAPAPEPPVSVPGTIPIPLQYRDDRQSGQDDTAQAGVQPESSA